MAGNVHVGRQAIHDADGRLHGYELLFRSTAGATSATLGDDAATTATILAAFSEFDPASLLGGRTGFINLTRAFLTGQLPLPFPPEGAMLEVLEDVELDAELVAGAHALAAKGYRLALDDFVWSPAAAPLLDVADVVKLDVLSMPWDDVLRTVERCTPHGVRLLAEKVEDETVLRNCLAAGFELFQGYHLARPETLTAETLTPAQALSLDLIGRLSDPATSAADIEEAVRSDPALSYRLLRIANSAAYGGQRQVSSVRDALVLVGFSRLRAWLVLLSLDTPGGDPDPMTAALARARTCEQLARVSGLTRPDVAFTAGLLSGVADGLGLAPGGLLDKMPSLAPELADALLGTPGPLRTVLETVVGYERQDLTRLGAVPLETVAGSYLSSLAWTTATTSALTPG